MLRSLKYILCLALMMAGVQRASSFSLLGPFETWQTAGLGYNSGAFGEDIGAPVVPHDEFRWNVPVITYAFDSSFIEYFGPRGVIEVEKAMNVFNNLPLMSSINSNLTDYPLQSLRVNYRAQALRLLDLKSMAMHAMVEQLGLAQAERYVWALRSRVVVTPPATNYAVIQRNFDPVNPSLASKLVNGVMYTYRVEEPLLPGDYADAIEYRSDMLAFPYSTVSYGIPVVGGFFTGLTRDDVGGLRFLYNRNHENVEYLNADTTNVTAYGSISGGYQIIFGSNFTQNATNQVVAPAPGGTNGTGIAAVRSGIDKINFVRVNFYSIYENTIAPYDYYYTDTIRSTGVVMSAYVHRHVVTPDIVFAVADLGVDADGYGLTSYSRTPGFVSNDAINGSTTRIGPGVKQGPILITFNLLMPTLFNDDFFTDEANASPSVIWGSYDGTTNAPVVYPQFLNMSAAELERQILGR